MNTLKAEKRENKVFYRHIWKKTGNLKGIPDKAESENTAPGVSGLPFYYQHSIDSRESGDKLNDSPEGSVEGMKKQTGSGADDSAHIQPESGRRISAVYLFADDCVVKTFKKSPDQDNYCHSQN